MNATEISKLPTPRTDKVMFVGDAAELPISEQEYSLLAENAMRLERECAALMAVVEEISDYGDATTHVFLNAVDTLAAIKEYQEGK